MKTPANIKKLISLYWSHGDIKGIRSCSAIKYGHPLNRITIANCIKNGEGNEKTIDIIKEFYLLKLKKYEGINK